MALPDARTHRMWATVRREHGITHVLNVVDPRFVVDIFGAPSWRAANYPDTGHGACRTNTRTNPSPKLTGVKLGDDQFARWRPPPRVALALVGIGVEPAWLTSSPAAADNLFSGDRRTGCRDASNMVVADYEFAPSFGI